MCCGGVRSILLLPLVARCLETIDVCICRMYVFMYVLVIVWGSVRMFIVVKDSGFLGLGVLKSVVRLCKGCDRCCVLFVL